MGTFNDKSTSQLTWATTIE